MLLRLADTCFTQGSELLDEGSLGTASTLLALAARLAPANPRYLYQAARAARALGERDRVAEYCERALLLDPAFVPAHELLMGTYLHGSQYLEVLRQVHAYLRPRTYVEIGTATGDSLRLGAPETVCIGIDPDPQINFALPPNMRVFRQTSDDFFARQDLRALLGGLPIDLAFIDGMHQFDFALRDFANIERHCTPQATILIHDCFPLDRKTAERERQTSFWSGDVWRLVVLLKRYRPDLRIHTVATPPTGLAIIRNLDPASRVLAGRLEALREEFLALDYSYLKRDRARKLNLFPNDWKQIQALLAN
jgi:hypothetical protein